MVNRCSLPLPKTSVVILTILLNICESPFLILEDEDETVTWVIMSWSFWWLGSKESSCNAGDCGLIPGLERSPGEKKNGTPLQYSCLENPMERGPWRVIVHGVTKEFDATW